MADGTEALPRSVHGRERAARNALHLFAMLFAAAGLVFAVVAWLAGDVFYFRLATEALILAGLAVSVDLLLGHAGLLSLGQALYFGLGAYVSALVLKNIAPSFWLAILAALVVGTAAGAIGGWIAIRARGVYFALITFGLAQVVAKIVYNTRELGASDGIIGIPQIVIDLGIVRVDTADAPNFFLFLLAATLALYAGLSYLADTPFGRVLAALRVNERRVPFLGYDSRRYKLIVFVLAADIAAIWGAFYPMLRGFVSPELMYFAVSGNAVITVVLGGVGTLIGPVYGSVVLTVLRSVVGTVTEHHLIVIGLLFMAAVIFLPKGMIGYLRSRVGDRLAWREEVR
jgi:branched-chain amino acid transport system permease protein